MLKEFIEFVDDIIPSISIQKTSDLKKALEQFRKDGDNPAFMMPSPLEEVSQGDIITNVKFTYISEDGNFKVLNHDGMLLSTSCHIDQKDKLVVVPVLPLTSFNGNLNDLKNNKIFDFMYIPDPCMKDKFINFEIVNSISRKLIISALADNKIQRIGSLNTLGYYLLLTKLTIYFMRREDDVTYNMRLNYSPK